MLSGRGSSSLRAGFITIPYLAQSVAQAEPSARSCVSVLLTKFQIRSKAQDSLFATALRLTGGLGSVGAQSHHNSRRGLQPVAALPSHARAVFQLHLSGFHKRRIVVLGNLDTAVAQPQRNLI